MYFERTPPGGFLLEIERKKSFIECTMSNYSCSDISVNYSSHRIFLRDFHPFCEVSTLKDFSKLNALRRIETAILDLHPQSPKYMILSVYIHRPKTRKDHPPWHAYTTSAKGYAYKVQLVVFLLQRLLGK